LEGKWADFASAEILASLGFTVFRYSRGFSLNPRTVSGLLLPAASREYVVIPMHACKRLKAETQTRA
jgi:hypothetical protein